MGHSVYHPGRRAPTGAAPRVARDAPAAPARGVLSLKDFHRWRSVVLNVTSRCALDCPFCNEKPHHFQMPDLPLDDVKRRISEYAERGYHSVCMMSGDVLMRRDFPEIIEWIAKRHGMVPAVATTGERLDDAALLEELVARGRRHLEFSLAAHAADDADLAAAFG